jgi:hypothetical protein
MTERDVLQSFLVVSVVGAALLILIGTGLLVRSLLDLEYQSVRGITGFPRIQAWMNLRGQSDRALLGLVFVIINVLLLAGAPEIVRMWVNRVGWTLLLFWVVINAVLDWFAARQQVKLVEAAAQARQDQQREFDAESIDSYQQIAAKALDRLETKVHGETDPPGSVRPDLLAPVVPEHSSPMTERQRRTADIATQRARLVAVDFALGIKPETEPSAEAQEKTS